MPTIPHPVPESPRGRIAATAAPSSEPGVVGDLGWALRATSIAFQAWADGSVTEIPGGARGYLVLVAAADGAAQSQLAIARHLGLDRTVMTHLTDQLEQRELVERKVDPADRRVRLVVITNAGREVLTTARRRLQVAENRLLAPLEPEQRRVLRDLLAAVAAASQGASDTCDLA